MAWRSHGSTNAELVSKLWSHNVLKTTRVRDALAATDRAHFVPWALKNEAYLDCPQPIGHGATISAPHMHAHALEELQDKLIPGAKFLDVGSGTGVLLAAAARLVAPGGKIYGVEHIPELVEMSVTNLKKDPQTASWLSDGTITVQVGDGYAGLSQYGPFDCIHVGAAAPSIPQALIDQLAPGGRMVLPVGKTFQEFTAIEKDETGHVTKRNLCAVSFVPLTTKEKQEGRGTGIFGF